MLKTHFILFSFDKKITEQINLKFDNNEIDRVTSTKFVCNSLYFQCETSRKSQNCGASVIVRVKRNSKDVRYRDPFVGRGLCAVMTINNQHTHLLENAEAWKWLKRTPQTEATLLE